MSACETCGGTRRVTDERDGKVLSQPCPACAPKKIQASTLTAVSDALVTEAMGARGSRRGEAYAKACLRAASALEVAAGIAALRELEARTAAAEGA